MGTISEKKTYYTIDVAKFIFACLIPLLHIPFTSGIGVDIARQYFARIGVPFFFATTGFLLTEKMQATDRVLVFKKQFQSIGRILLIWLAIYLVPLLLIDDAFLAAPIRTLLFKTPAYLWYLTAVLFGLVPFCLIKSKRVRWGGALCLYIIGTLFSESYTWLSGSINWYDNVFLTYRNGLFFAFPVMCVGEAVFIAYKRNNVRDKAFLGMILSFLLFCCEVTFVRSKSGASADTSMTLMIPVVVFFLLLELVNNNRNQLLYCPWMRKASTAVYVMQFSFIFLGKVVQKLWGNSTILWIIIYLAIIVVPTIFVAKFENKRFMKIFF